MTGGSQAFVVRELGNCEVEHVACGSGLERIYRFLQSDERCNRPDFDLEICKVCLLWSTQYNPSPS
jgi:glucokinase